MRNNKIYLLLLLVILILIAGCNNDTQNDIYDNKAVEDNEVKNNDNGESDDILVYTNEEYGIECTYFNHWELKQNYLGTIVMFMSPLENEEDEFRENVNIVVEDLSAQEMEIDLETYSEASIDVLKKTLPDVNVLSNESYSLNDLDANRITFIGTQDIYSIKFMQVHAIKEGKAYVITYSASEDKYDEYMVYMNQILEDFTIK